VAEPAADAEADAKIAGRSPSVQRDQRMLLANA
jgi:hypothetical protein